jgi:uncharacterized protein involved in exopolysaccharide biosynthesis
MIQPINTLLKRRRRPTAKVDQDAFDLRALQDFLWRRWTFLAAGAFICTMIAILILLTITPLYTSTAQVLLDPRKERIFGADSIFPELSLDAATIDSQISILQSTSLLQRVIDKERLYEDPEFSRQNANSLWRRATQWLGGTIDTQSSAQANPADSAAEPRPETQTISSFKSALDVQRVARSYVLSISITSRERQKAAHLANAVTEAYVADQFDTRDEAARRASAWLAERMESLSAQLRHSEEALNDFRRQHNIVTTSSEARSTISE